MNYLPRALADTIRRAIRTFPAVLLTGARQSGKTTLLRNEFGDKYRYVSLERPDVRQRALADPVAFLAENAPPVILDEIQYATDLLSYVKDRIDANRRPGQWLLTGSQKFQLMRGVSETLAGRVAVLELDPLSTREFVGMAPLASVDELIERCFAAKDGAVDAAHSPVDLGDWLLRGSYPEPRINSEVDRQLWFASYVQTYLERDVREIVQVGDLATFSRFLALVAARTGTMLNAADLARDLGVSGPTIKRWLSVLETSHIIYLLPPYHRNFGKRIRKSPKIYLIDPGLATFMLGLHSAEAVLNGPFLGPLVETAVIAEWIKASRQLGQRAEFFYWRSSAGVEVDLVIERNGRLYGLEIKATATPVPRHADAIAQWLALAGNDARGSLACRVDRATSLRPGVRAVPWHLAW